MKIKPNFMLLSIVALLLIVFSIFQPSLLAESNYVTDKANVLSSSMETKINDNLSKLENNSGAQLKIYTLKSLEGKNINEIADNITKNFTTKKYAVFIVTIKEHKNKFLIGPGLNGVFSSQELSSAASIPNNDFKKGDFNTGMLRISQYVDKKITSKLIKEGKLEVKNDGLGITVSRKPNYALIILCIIVILLIVGLLILFIKRKADKEIDNFAEKNGLDSDENDSDTVKFRSASMSNNSKHTSTNNHIEYANSPNYKNNYEKHTERAGHTTIINNIAPSSTDNGFVEGMILGDLLNEHHPDHETIEESHDYDDSENITNPTDSDDINEENDVTSGDYSLLNDSDSDFEDNESNFDSGDDLSFGNDDNGSDFDSGDDSDSNW